QGSLAFTGAATIAFNTVTPTVHHKQDVDQFEDGCLTSLQFAFSYGTGCRITISAGTCVDLQGRMKVQSVMFTADSQCPGFPDAIEGTYNGTAATLEGSYIAMSAPRIADRNVASSCVTDQF